MFFIARKWKGRGACLPRIDETRIQRPLGARKCFSLIAVPLITGSGKLDFDSFYRVASHFQEEDDEALQKELKEAFRLYDKEGNGYIPTSSLREILAALDDQITPDQMDGMIAEIDTDGSGTVDFDGKRLVPLIE